MSYQVLSRKWRPQRFNEVVGQSHVTRTLQNALEMERVGHGYIFAGPRGVGKTTTARILAKVLNCSNVKENNPCGTCANCDEITRGSSLDVQELDGASNRGIDEIRDLREAVKYPPNRGKYRIYIIDEVHMLTGPAFNALLKTLEEPPAHVIFIMATTDSHKIPTTILSRTQRFDFKPISNKDISNYLIQILEQENIQFELEGISLIAKKAEGSLRDSLSLLDQIIAYAQDKLDAETIRDVLGVIKENVFLEIIQTIQQKDYKQLISQLNRFLDEGFAISDLISGLNEYLRNCMLQKGGTEGNNLSGESESWLLTDCKLSTSDFLRMLDLTLQFESNLKFIQQPLISLEALFMKLAMMDASIDIAQVLSGNNPTGITVKKTEKNQSPPQDNFDSKPELSSGPEEKAETAPGPSASVSEPNPIEKKNISLEDITNSWAAIITELENQNSKIAHFLEEAILKEFDGKQLMIELINGHRFHLKTLEKDILVIESIMKNILQHSIKIKFQIQESTEIKSKQKKVENLEHPLFMKVLETFEGEIIR